jgi:hypothetical protein
MRRAAPTGWYRRVKPSGPADRQAWVDLNVFSGPGLNHGRDLFVRARPSTVDLTRRGNTVEMRQDVAALTLLISPDGSIFRSRSRCRPTARRRAAARGTVSGDAAQMGGARRDRTMLFGAEAITEVTRPD